MNTRPPMNYRIYRCSTRELIDALPMHVLAYAYCRAWTSLYGSHPCGKHVIAGVDLLIEFLSEPINAGGANVR